MHPSYRSGYKSMGECDILPQQESFDANATENGSSSLRAEPCGAFRSHHSSRVESRPPALGTSDPSARKPIMLETALLFSQSISGAPLSTVIFDSKPGWLLPILSCSVSDNFVTVAVRKL